MTKEQNGTKKAKEDKTNNMKKEQNEEKTSDKGPNDKKNDPKN